MFRPMLVLALACPLGLAATPPQANPVAQTNETLRNLTQQAQIAFESGEYQQAHEQLKQALSLAPENPGLWKYLGLTDAQLGQPDAAIEDFHKALSFDPKDADSEFNLGRLYQAKGDNAHALEMYAQGLTLAPGDPSANQNYALLLMGAGKFHQAIVPLLKLRAVDDSNLSTRATLIECYLKSGEAERGRQDVIAYLAAPNATPADKLKLAKLLVDDQFPDLAEFILTSDLQQSPDLPETHDLRGVLSLYHNQYEQAVTEFRHATQSAPNTAEYASDLANALILAKRFQEAFEFLQSTEKSFGDQPEFRFKMGVVLYGTRHYLEAISVFEKLDQAEPNLDTVQYYLGNCYSENGDLNTGLSYYRKAIALNPRRATYYAALAKWLRKEGDDKTDEAILNLQKAIRLDPSDTSSKQDLAVCYERKHDYPKAEGLLREVVAKEPDNTNAHVALSRIYYQDHKKVEGDAEKKIILRLEAQQEPAAVSN
jgi:tetratricopeptide (TPR) repeat protein